ncbi:dTDP-glucose 4,6-dehydratase [Rubritalea spongiae]|uniref:dTDP-glucose 4,6-dehydratase n=1 Tax=Rubritalea spongiae TaxID=430797 RepID=A0ABW5E8L5_9BACT
MHTEQLPTIIVTGGAGFIGSALCRYLIGNRLARVVNVDVMAYAASFGSTRDVEVSPDYFFRQVDVCDRRALQGVFEEFQPDGIMHLAAESHVDRSIIGAQAFVRTNVVGTSVLLDVALDYWRGLEGKCRDKFKFLHVSTDEVYGSLGDDGVFTEESGYDPSSPYSASKAASDHLVSAWGRTYGLPVVISHCSNNFGPYQFPEKLIPVTILNAIRGRGIPIYGNGLQVRDWLHVEDHATALWALFEEGRNGEKYNVGANVERSNLELVREICQILDGLCDVAPEGGYAQLIEHVTDRPGHDLRYAIDATKLKSELGWRAQKDFSEALRETVQWYLDNRDWWEPLINEESSL